MAAILRRVVWRPGTMALTGLVAGIVATALVVHWTDPFAVSAAAVAPVPPPERTITLNWGETWTPRGSSGALQLDIATVSLNKDGTWTVSASMRNASTVRILLSQGGHVGATARPGLAYEEGASLPPPYSGPSLVPLVASTVTPPLPSLLAPGESWNGWFVGPEKIPRGKEVHVVFGRFDLEGEENRFYGTSYSTTHTFVLKRAAG